MNTEFSLGVVEGFELRKGGEKETGKSQSDDTSLLLSGSQKKLKSYSIKPE